jgi:hypothetical protein
VFAVIFWCRLCCVLQATEKKKEKANTGVQQFSKQY